MSLQSQIKNMKLLGALLSLDLGYIYGERENGPNGAKKQFHTTGSAFLRALGKDLGFTQQKVYINKAGIACSGEVYLRGIWKNSGVKLELSQDMLHNRCIHYRMITDMHDTSGGYTHSMSLDELKRADYAGLILKLLGLQEDGYERFAA